MRATSHPNFGLIDGIPGQLMLDGLANLHQSVAVTDTEGTVLWASPPLERLLGDTDDSAGPGLAALCVRYLETQNEAAGGAARFLPERNARTAPVQARLSDRIAEILRLLEQRGSLCQCPIEAAGMELEFNAFRVTSRPPQKEHGVPGQSSVPLYVVILRPAQKHEDFDTRPGEVSTFYERVLDQLPEATLTIDSFGFVTYANASVVSLLGRSRRELVDTPISLLVPSSAILPISASLDLDPKAEAEASETTERAVVEFTPRERPRIYLEVLSRNLDLPDGRNAGRIVQLRDTTSQLRVAERFKRKIASLESYVHKVSHDLRSPLVSLLGFTRLMKQDYETILDDTGRKFLNCIEQAGSKMNTMTRDLLEQSTQEPSNPNRDPVNPRPILLKIRAELKPQLEARGVHLELPAAPPMIECEAIQLAQIFSHLISHALQHLGARERPQIIVEIYPGADQKIITVRVDYRGIDANIEPGGDCEGRGPIGDNAMRDACRERVDAGSHSGGVDGLAIVKEIADEHGGRVWFDCAPGEGVAFHVSFPTT